MLKIVDVKIYFVYIWGWHVSKTKRVLIGHPLRLHVRSIEGRAVGIVQSLLL